MSVSRSSSPGSDILPLYDTIVPEREQKQAGTTSIDFNGLLNDPLVLHEDLKEGCGGQLWPAGMLLSKYMLAYHKMNLSDKYIIEIGAGGGLVGLAVALGCNITSQVCITDQSPMLPLMLRNIDLNGLSRKVEARVYDWGSTLVPTFPTVSGHPDIVLAADCVYFEPAFPLLLRTLQDLIGPSTKCFFSFKKRRKADMRFIKDMKKTFDVQEVDYEGREGDRRDNVFLYQLAHKAKQKRCPRPVPEQQEGVS